MRYPLPPPRRPSSVARYLVPSILLATCLYFLSSLRCNLLSRPGSRAAPPPPRPETPPAAELATGSHPIDVQIRAAEASFAQTLSQESHTLNDAAAAYRERRGRHPPPGFGEWYQFAKERDALVVEEFWDQIYHDLEPFWALKPARIRKDANEFEMRITVRGGKASTGSDWFWTQIWLSLVGSIEHLLPDMDIALNAMDEPRLVVPWEKMSEYAAAAEKTRRMKDARGVVSKFGSLPGVGEAVDGDEETPPKRWEDESKIFV